MRSKRCAVQNQGITLSVNVFSTKVLIGDTIFTSPKILNIGPVPGIEPEIEPAISRSAVKRCTD